MDKDLVLYGSGELNQDIEVRLEDETVWLSQHSMAVLFGTQRPAITKHLSNIFKTGELDKKVVSSILEHTTEHGAIKGKTQTKSVKHYNLDAVISVGYRVNSVRATQFRIWATQVLKNHILSKARQATDKDQADKYSHLTQAIQFVASVATKHKEENLPLSSDEAIALLKVLSDYQGALDLLDRYDHQQLEIPKGQDDVYILTYEDAKDIINTLQKKYGGSKLFANEMDDSFKGSIGAIYQTFDGKDVYLSLEEKAANLLYFVTKNHSFTDGNKRIAAALFTIFLDRNKALYDKNGFKRLSDETLVAVTLMIAASNPEDKAMMIKMVVNLMGM